MSYNKLELLKKENNASAALLDPELQGEIKLMVKYVRSKGLGMYETEIFRKDIIGMSQEACVRGESLPELLGSTNRDFCDSVLESSGKRKAESVFYVLYHFSIMMLFFALIQIFLYGYNIPINNAFLLVAAMYLIGSWTGVYLDKYYICSGWRAYIPYYIPAIVWGGFIIVCFYIRNNHVLDTLLTIGWVPLVFVHLALFLVLRLIWNYHIEKISEKYVVQA